jgi:uncharacterized membrane-anchored protein YhcB (DUF1043 family)
MEFGVENWMQIAIGGGLFVAGLIVGLLAGRAGDRTRSRLREVEAELDQEREQSAAYRDAVGKHFDQTSDLFRDLTHQYTSLYAHLAEGARDLCGDRMPALARGFGEPLLQAGTSPAEEPPVDEELPEPTPEEALELERPRDESERAGWPADVEEVR